MFRMTKQMINIRSVIALSCTEKTIHNYTGFTKEVPGAVLIQKKNKRNLSDAQSASQNPPKAGRVYSTLEKKGAAVIFHLETFGQYLLAVTFLVYSDHKALPAAFEKADIRGRLTEWLDLMEEYAFRIQYVDGSPNVIAGY